jgi:hypothetical protein
LVFRRSAIALALYQERKVKPRRADDGTRIILAGLSRFLEWRQLLVIVTPETLIRWHRRGFRLFWRWKSGTPRRPAIPTNVQRLIAAMAAANGTWGGAPRPLTTLDVTKHENSHRYPTFLPDGRHFLYFIRSDDREVQGIYLGSLERPQEKIRLALSTFSGVYAPGLGGQSGYLLWLRNGALVAQPFDAKSFIVSGEAVTVANSIQNLEAPARMSPVSVSGSGTLIYGSSPEPHYQLTWYEREGKPVGTVGAPDTYLNLQISPDGQQVALIRVGPSARDADLWLMDLGRGVPSRLTFEGANINGPAWSPDGGRMASLTLYSSWPADPAPMTWLRMVSAFWLCRRPVTMRRRP